MGKYTSRPQAKSDTPVSFVADGKDRGFAAACPAVIEYLTDEGEIDGVARQRSTVTVIWEDGFWKLCLNDRDNSRSCWVSAGTLVEAWEALERALSSDTADWRRWHAATEKKGGRRKGS